MKLQLTSFVNGHSSGPLLQTLKGQSSLRSYAFVGGVGGIAFGGVAVPDTNIGLRKIGLVYDPARRDGERFGVRIESKVYYMPIYDWKLIPIARYSDSRHNACVSLFGPRTTAAQYDIIYHPEFKDTLLGMRLLQSDIMFFDLGETWQLPKLNGRLVLGGGETAPNSLDYASVRDTQSELNRSSFQSWVMTDQDAPVRISWDGKQVSLSGEPYYYFWIADLAGYQRRVDSLTSKVVRLRRAGRVQEHNRLVNEINAMEPSVTDVKALTDGLKRKVGALEQGVRDLEMFA